MINASAQVSPIAPPHFPKNRSILDGRVPSAPLKIANGVAEETVSIFGNTLAVIAVLKEINRKILAVIAGLAKFCPIPPKNDFTTMMAKT